MGPGISETAFPQQHQRVCVCVFLFFPFMEFKTDKAQSCSCVLICVFIRAFGQGYLGNMSSFILKAAVMWPSSKLLCKVSGFQSSFWFLDIQKFSDFYISAKLEMINCLVVMKTCRLLVLQGFKNHYFHSGGAIIPPSLFNQSEQRICLCCQWRAELLRSGSPDQAESYPGVFK